jgi:hypothetical protein
MRMRKRKLYAVHKDLTSKTYFPLYPNDRGWRYLLGGPYTKASLAQEYAERVKDRYARIFGNNPG